MFPKQLLYLTGDQLQAWQWQDGALSGPVVFPATRGGVDAFTGYLEEQGPRPAWLLVDLIEEDFTRHLLPHVRGRAGRQLRARRLAQQYRDTPLRTALVQGRAPEGRRDDVVLFTALTNPALVMPWIDALEQVRTPLAGVYSTTLLARLVAERLPVRHPHLLLVTPQAGALRQAYFRDGQLKFARLVQGAGDGATAMSVLPETARTRQFLTSVHLLGRDDPLHVLVLAPARDVDALLERCVGTALTDYEIMPLPDAARLLRLKPAAVESVETLMLHLLARQPGGGHYPLGDKAAYFRLWRARLSLFASSAVIATAGVAWTIANLLGNHTATTAANGLRSETAHYQAAYRNSMSSMPPAIDKTINMRAAVQIDRLVALQGPWPMQMMDMVSVALEQSPRVRLVEIEWRADVPGTATAGAAAGPGGAPAVVAPVSSLALGIPRPPRQTLRLQAEVVEGQDSYRAVLESMNAFAQQLAAMPRVTVEITELPFDIRSNVKLSGSAGGVPTEEDRNRFTLDLAWTP